MMIGRQIGIGERFSFSNTIRDRGRVHREFVVSCRDGEKEGERVSRFNLWEFNTQRFLTSLSLLETNCLARRQKRGKTFLILLQFEKGHMAGQKRICNLIVALLKVGRRFYGFS